MGGNAEEKKKRNGKITIYLRYLVAPPLHSSFFLSLLVILLDFHTFFVQLCSELICR